MKEYSVIAEIRTVNGECERLRYTVSDEQACKERVRQDFTEYLNTKLETTGLYNPITKGRVIRGYLNGLSVRELK